MFILRPISLIALKTFIICILLLQCFTVDTESRLWKLSSLRADVITHYGFYVPNLLPKSTPRKKKPTKNINMITNEEHRVNSCRVDKETKDINEGTVYYH